MLFSVLGITVATRRKPTDAKVVATTNGTNRAERPKPAETVVKTVPATTAVAEERSKALAAAAAARRAESAKRLEDESRKRQAEAKAVAATADKVAADKVAADKVAADKVAADKVAADKVATNSLNDILAPIAAHLLAGRATTAAKSWREAQNAPELKLFAKDLAAINSQLAAATSLDAIILASFRKDIGRSETIYLRKGKVQGKIREVSRQGIKMSVVLPGGKGTMGRTVKLQELGVREKLRRLGKEDTPDRNIMRGLLAVEADRLDVARKLFEKAAGPLGKALTTALTKLENKEAETAADRAARKLLRTIARSTSASKRAVLIREIRAKCSKSLANVQQARKLLVDYEKEHEETETGKKWIVLVRDALTCPCSGEDWIVSGVGMEFIWIKAMKTWVGKYEVTNGEYRVKEPRYDSKTYKGYTMNADRQPVVYVNWDDACAYAVWLTERERAAGRLPDGLRYRLPTEKEFTTFAQCGDEREYPWGDNWPPRSGQAGNYHGDEGANSWTKIKGYRDGHPVTCVVEKSWANSWNLYGVGGNVWECCAKDTSTKQPFGTWRGASWYGGSQGSLRCSGCSVGIASYRYVYFGFRLVLSR